MIDLVLLGGTLAVVIFGASFYAVLIYLLWQAALWLKEHRHA